MRNQSRAAMAFAIITFSVHSCFSPLTLSTVEAASPRPNILLAISDDQSFAHTSAAGCLAISTPNFDRVARAGVLFRHAFAASPGCSPSRAALLTGRHTWQIEHAGTHASSFSSKFAVYPDLLEAAGYHVGYTGKGWGPGNWKIGGRQRNPAGPVFSRRKLKSAPAQGISRTDYAGNFVDFLDDRPEGVPFCFWYGGHEPHRRFEKGVGAKRGKDPGLVDVPPFLPDTPETRDDLLDYLYEIEHFDQHLGRMLDLLESRGELENTLVIVTSDNGMAFPAAKANCFEYGIHVPMTVQWTARAPGGRIVDDFVGFVDLAPTFLEAAGLPVPDDMSGHGLLSILTSKKQGMIDASRDAAFSARERHSSSRFGNLAYPQRSIRTRDYLYIRNFRPERWPAGTPRKLENRTGKKNAALEQFSLGPPHGGYHDIDACPTLDLLIAGRDDPAIAPFFRHAVAKRPAEELYDIRSDPGCMHNLAYAGERSETKTRLRQRLESMLLSTRDPRMVDGGDVFETYKRYSRLRSFPPPESKQ